MPSIYSGLPSAQRAFTRKYSNPATRLALQRVAPHVRSGLLNLDLQRANRGQPPLSPRQTAGGIASIANRTAATQPEPEGLFGRIGGDIRSLVDIPKMVGGLVSEVKALPSAPQKLSEALGKGSPTEILKGLQDVPGIRDIPGVFTLSQAAKGPGGLLEHPVFTALDVLPFAKEPIASLAERAVVSERSPFAGRVAQARALDTTPVRSALRQTLGFQPLPTPSNVRLLARSSPAAHYLRTRPLYQQMQRAMGKLVGDTAQLASGEESRLKLSVNPNTPIDHPGLTDITRPLNKAIKDMAGFTKSLTHDRRRYLTDQIMLPTKLDGTPGSIKDILARPDLSDTDRAFLQTAKDHSDAIADVVIARDLGLRRLEDGEIYTRADAKTLHGRRLAASVHQSIHDARSNLSDMFTGPGRDGSAFPTIDTEAILREGAGAKAVKRLGNLAAARVRLAGFDSAEILAATKGRAPHPQSIIDAIDRTRANPIVNPLLSPDDIELKLRGLADQEQRTEPGTSYYATLEHLKRGQYTSAARKFRDTIFSRTTHRHPDADLIMESLNSYRDANNAIRSSYKDFSKSDVTKALRNARQSEARILPARFFPKVEELRSQSLYEMFRNNPDASKLIDQGGISHIQALRDDPGLLKTVQDDAIAMVQQLRKEGFDPQFVHRVSTSQVREITYPHLSDVFRVPSQVKTRTFDASPYVHDLAVAVSHQAAEVLTRIHTETFIDHFTTLFGRDKHQLIDEYLPMAESLAKVDPSKSVFQHAEEMLEREFKRYDPSNIFPTGKARIGTVPKQGEIWIPIASERILKDMFREPPKFAGAFDPVMNLFRMSVLAFSPRFQINNLGGGAILTTVQEPRTILTILTRFKEIRDLMRSGEMELVPGMPPSGFGMLPGLEQEWMHNLSPLQRLIANHQWLGGRTLRRWLDEAASGEGPLSDTQRFTGAPKKAADVMYRLNGIVDDFYRATAYLTGHDQALVKNLSEREAQQAGVALVRKVLPEWDRISPFERNVVRSIFPFYTFAKFLVSYSMHYPMDHPFRTAIAQNLVRNEMQEFGDWLPQRFASMFFVGHPDAKGNQTAISLSGINPFTDVANYFTLQGYVGKVNPIISTFLETMGVDPSKGTQDLYPDISYNPVTGALQPRNPNLLASLAGNLIPQTQVVAALVGRNKNFTGMLRANPESAAAYLRSSIGLPNYTRQINLPQEAFKAETQRQSVQDTIRNEALRTGDWSRAMRLPGLRPFFTKLDGIMKSNPEIFKAYQGATQQGTAGTFFTALLQRNLPIGQ